jgi:chaperone required for assembly of F1-ATPase
MLQNDQFHYIDDLINDNQRHSKQKLEEYFSGQCFPDIISKLETSVLLLLECLSKDHYSPKISLGIIRGEITPEDAVDLSLAEESYQLKSWPSLPEYHEANRKLLLSRIYFYEALVKLNGGIK